LGGQWLAEPCRALPLTRAFAMPPKASKPSLQGRGQNSVSFSSGMTRGWASKAPASARSRGNGMAFQAALCALICTTVPSSCVGISTNRAPMGFVGVPNPQLRRRLAPSSLHVFDGATRDSSIARGIGVGQVNWIDCSERCVALIWPFLSCD